MILRLSSPAARALLALIALAFAVGLSYFSIRAARAAYFAGRNTREGFARAAQLEPSNARYWSLLGRYWQYNLADPDPRRAIQAYRYAVSLDPRSAAAWLDLGTAFESEGDLASARDAFLQAQRAYPLSAEVSWRYGNFLLRRGELDPAFAQIRHAVEIDPKHAAEAFSRCVRVVPDIDAILNRVLPPSRDVYLGVVQALTEEGQTEPALTVWSRLAALHPHLPLSNAFGLVNALIEKKRMAEARHVWDQAVAFAGISPPPDPPGSLVWDGGFESGIVGGGFAWRYPQTSEGVQIGLDSQEKHAGNHSLRLTFDGKHNVNFTDVCEYLAVQPSVAYRFSAWVHTRELSTDQGLRFLLQPIAESETPSFWTPDVRGSEPWTRIEIPWTSGKDVRGLRICVGRSPSRKLDSQIQGLAWVDDIALLPGSAERARP